MTAQAKRDIRRKLEALSHAQKTGNISKTSRFFGISREIFYQWKRAYEAQGEVALVNSKPCPENQKLRVPQEIEEKILHLRKTYLFSAEKISWNLSRYHAIKVSSFSESMALNKERHITNRCARSWRVEENLLCPHCQPRLFKSHFLEVV